MAGTYKSDVKFKCSMKKKKTKTSKLDGGYLLYAYIILENITRGKRTAEKRFKFGLI